MQKMLMFVLVLMFPSGGSAHHSISSLYDYDNIVSLEGTVQKIYWINPHVRINIETINEDGLSEIWRLDGGALNLLQRIGVTRDMVRVPGEKVKRFDCTIPQLQE